MRKFLRGKIINIGVHDILSDSSKIIRFVFPLDILSSRSLCDALSRDDVLGTEVVALFGDRSRCCVMVRVNITNVGQLQRMSSRFIGTSYKFTRSLTELFKDDLAGYEIEVSATSFSCNKK